MKIANIVRSNWRSFVVCSVVLFCVTDPFAPLIDVDFSFDDESQMNRELKLVDDRYLRALDDRPLIFTFHEPIPMIDRRTGMTDEQDQQMLQAWRETWEAAGWRTKILTLKDAIPHPYYEDGLKRLQKVTEGNKQSKYEILCYLRWLAMAQTGGGWMSDFDVLPLSLKSGIGRGLPNGGNFTAHDGAVPSLLSGSQREWDRIARKLIDVLEETPGYVSDMNTLKYIISNKPEIKVITENHVLRENAYSSLDKVDCPKTKDKMAVHFSHYRMIQAFELGLMPHLTDFHDTPGERPPYGKKFLENWAKQCGIKRTTIYKRPTIYTYYEPQVGPDGDDTERIQNEEMLETWKSVWTEYGWIPKVLSEENALDHPDIDKYEKLLNNIPSQEQRMPFYKFIAMATISTGGFYSDFDTFPLYMGANDFSLPNSGRFTMYDGFMPSFMSADFEEWNRITNTLFESLEKIEGDTRDIITALQNLWVNGIEGPSVSNNQIYRFTEKYNGLDESKCRLYRRRRAIHFRFAASTLEAVAIAPEFFREWHETCVMGTNK